MAKKAKLHRIKLDNEEKDELTKLMEATPSLKRQLDAKVAYAPPEGVWLENIQLKSNTSEPLIVFVNPKLRKRRGSIIQWANDGSPASGFTLQANRND